MLTLLQRLKQIRLFNLIDVDRNAFMEREDWTLIGDRLAQVRGIAEGSEKYKIIQNTMEKLWNDLSLYVGGTNPNRANLEEWLNFADEKVVNCTDEWYDSYVNKLVRGVFALIDEDNNGTIEAKEYYQFMSCFRVSKEDAQLAFEKMDLNSDRCIDESELIRSVHEFLKSDNVTSPGNALFGPV